MLRELSPACPAEPQEADPEPNQQLDWAGDVCKKGNSIFCSLWGGMQMRRGVFLQRLEGQLCFLPPPPPSLCLSSTPNSESPSPSGSPTGLSPGFEKAMLLQLSGQLGLPPPSPCPALAMVILPPTPPQAAKIPCPEKLSAHTAGATAPLSLLLFGCGGGRGSPFPPFPAWMCRMCWDAQAESQLAASH